MESQTAEQHQCDHCNAAETPANPLKRCSRCLTARYCNRDCQMAAWKEHKNGCLDNSTDNDQGTNTRSHPSSTSKKGPQATHASPEDEAKDPNGAFLAATMLIVKSQWLENRPEEEVFGIVVDAYRWYRGSDFDVNGGVRQDALNGGGDPKVGFRHFLLSAERAGNTLPKWWSPAKRAACEHWAAQQMETEGSWSKLGRAIKMRDVNAHYPLPHFWALLHMLTEGMVGMELGGDLFSKDPRPIQQFTTTGADGQKTTYLML